MKEDEEDTNEYEDLDQQASTSDTPGNVSGPGEDLSQLEHDAKSFRLRSPRKENLARAIRARSHGKGKTLKEAMASAGGGLVLSSWICFTRREDSRIFSVVYLHRTTDPTPEVASSSRWQIRPRSKNKITGKWQDHR